MTRRTCIFFTALGLFACGCEHDQYEITMRHEGGIAHRTLTVRRVGSSKGESGKETFLPYSEEKLAAFAKLYGKRSDKPDHSAHSFTDTFEGMLPNDLGGPGTVAYVPSSMGHAVGYVERFRGDDDLAGTILRQLTAADRFIDLLIACAEREFGKQKGFAKLRAFLDKDLRRDLKNVLMYIRQHGGLDVLVAVGEGRNPAGEMLIARLMQYFLERGYIGPKEVPHVAKLLGIGGEPPEERLARRALRHVLTRKVGLGDEEGGLVEGVVAFFEEPAKAQESLHEAVRQSKEFQVRLQAWQKARQADPNAPEPTPDEMLTDISKDLMSWELKLSPRTDRLTVTFAADRPPLHTNGEWDKDKRAVVWKAPLEEEGSEARNLPTICYALWAHPDRKFQQARFGSVVLEGPALLEYCVWRNALDPAPGRKWDGFLAARKPGQDLPKELQAFLIREELAKALPDYPAKLVKHIAERLQPEPTKPATQPADGH